MGDVMTRWIRNLTALIVLLVAVMAGLSRSVAQAVDAGPSSSDAAPSPPDATSDAPGATDASATDASPEDAAARDAVVFVAAPEHRLRDPEPVQRSERRDAHAVKGAERVVVVPYGAEGPSRLRRRALDEPWISPMVDWLAKDRDLFRRLLEPQKPLLRRVVDEVRPIAAGLVFALILLLITVVVRVVLRHEPVARRLRAPANILVLYLGLFMLVVLARLAWPEVNQVLYFVSLFVLVLGAIQALVVGVVDVFLGRYRRIEMPVILRDIGMIVIYVVTIILVLGKAGVNLTSILTTSAVLTAIVGFALQETLSSIISGLAIQVEKPFEVGEFIQFKEQIGQVVEINWRTTKIVTAHRDVVVIPNNVLTREPLINFSAPNPVHRRKIKIGLPYEVPPNRVKETISRALLEVPGVLRDPEPQILLIEYADFSIVYRVYFYIREFVDREPIEDKVLTRVWYVLKRDGIRIPFPIQDLNVVLESPDKSSSLAQDEVRSRRRALDDVPLLAPLSPSERDELARRSRTVDFGAGEAVIRQGEPGDSFYVVAEGQVRVRVRAPGASADTVVATLGPGQFFGEMSLMTGEVRTATVTAAGDTVLHVVDREAFVAIIAANDELVSAIGGVLAERRALLDARRSAQRSAHSAGAGLEDQETIIKKIKNFFRI